MISDDHTKRYFSSSMGAAETGNLAGMMGVREERKSWDLVGTVEGRKGERFFLGMLGRRRVTLRWADDTVVEAG